MAIAEADIFGDKAVLERYGINQSTLWRWRDRANEDSKLHENALLKKRMLLIGWQQDASKTIKVALSELCRRMPLATTEEDAKVLHSIAGVAKVVGELKIASDALNEPISDLESQQFEA